jgi:TonB family protein
MLYKYRRLVAFIIALLIHILLFTPIFLYKKSEDKMVHESKKVLNLSQFQTPKIQPKLKRVPTPKTKLKPSRALRKPITTKPVARAIPTKAKNELNITKPIKTPKVEISQQPQKPQVSKPQSDLSAINDAFKSVKPIESKGPIKQLYGDEFERMTEAQKEFIKDNLGSIGRITQKYLKYPDAAGRLSMQGRSVVEFFLHPNGDISGLNLLDSSSYHVLDQNSLETIERAYKDYPRPSQTTKIRIYVHYQLY